MEKFIIQVAKEIGFDVIREFNDAGSTIEFIKNGEVKGYVKYIADKDKIEYNIPQEVENEVTEQLRRQSLD